MPHVHYGNTPARSKALFGASPLEERPMSMNNSAMQALMEMLAVPQEEVTEPAPSETVPPDAALPPDQGAMPPQAGMVTVDDLLAALDPAASGSVNGIPPELLAALLGGGMTR